MRCFSGSEYICVFVCMGVYIFVYFFNMCFCVCMSVYVCVYTNVSFACVFMLVGDKVLLSTGIKSVTTKSVSKSVTLMYLSFNKSNTLW